MYNGIGVQTPRGTGTSGYIETSLVSLKPPPLKPTKTQKIVPKQSKSIEEHNKKRRIELSCIKFRESLKKSNTPEAEIKMRVKKYRKSLLDLDLQKSKDKNDEQQKKGTESEINQHAKNLQNVE